MLIFAINERDFRAQERDKIKKVLLNTQFHEIIHLRKMCYYILHYINSTRYIYIWYRNIHLKYLISQSWAYRQWLHYLLNSMRINIFNNNYMLFFTQLLCHRVLHVCVPHTPDTLSSYYSNFILKNPLLYETKRYRLLFKCMNKYLISYLHI